jgi:UrcA family protein
MRSVLLAGVFGVALAVTSASAQDSSEQVQVTAPHFRAESAPLNGPLEKISLSSTVRTDDLNLRTRHGVRELRLRVRDEAKNVCTQLAQAYLVREAPGTSCYREAVDDAMEQADTAIDQARSFSD